MSRRRSNLPPNFGFQRVSAFHAPSAKRHVRSRACVPPMVSTPPSHPSALWNTLLSGSSITTGFQPFSVLRTMVSFAGPGTEVGLPSVPVPSTNCAWATRIAGYGPPTSGSRRGVLAEALAGGELGGVFSPPPPQAWSASRTASSAERGIEASSRVAARLSTKGPHHRAVGGSDVRGDRRNAVALEHVVRGDQAELRGERPGSQQGIEGIAMVCWKSRTRRSQPRAANRRGPTRRLAP